MWSETRKLVLFFEIFILNKFKYVYFFISNTILWYGISILHFELIQKRMLKSLTEINISVATFTGMIESYDVPKDSAGFLSVLIYFNFISYWCN